MKPTPRTIAELSHAVAAMLTAEKSDQTRFDAMALCAEVMDRCDLVSRSDALMSETLRSWIGKVQRKHGIA